MVRSCDRGRLFSLFLGFFMRTKDEAFEFVRDLILRLKNELPQAMRAIRSDNGIEFKNAHFDTFLQ